MHPEEIKAAMRMKGTTPAMLSDELGVSKATMSLVIHGRSESARIKASISKLLGKSTSTIWPNGGKPSLQRPKGSVKPRNRARA